MTKRKKLLNDKHHDTHNIVRKEVIKNKRKKFLPISVKEFFVSHVIKILTTVPKKEKAYVQKLRKKFPKASNEKLVKKVTWKAKQKAAGIGAASGMVPFQNAGNTMGVAGGLAMGVAGGLAMGVTDALAMFYIEVQLAARIALIYDPDFFDDDDIPPFELLVPILGIRFVGNGLKIIAQEGGKQAMRRLIRKYLQKETLKKLKKLSMKHFGMKITQKGIIKIALPIVSGLIGAGFNYVEINLFSKRVEKWIQYWIDDLLVMPNNLVIE